MAIVKQAYTTQELASLLGITVRAVNLRGRAESWLSRPRQGKGGGNEWLLESMPEPTRLTIASAIAARIAKERERAAPRIASEVFTVNTLAEVPDAKRRRASARALLVSMAREFGAASGAARSAAYEVFCHEYNRGAIIVAGWVREELPRVCRSSLTGWESSIGKEGLASLAGRHGHHRKGSGIIDSTPGMADVVIAHIIEYYDVAADYVLRALKTKFKELPNLRSLQRWMKQYRDENESTILRIQNPDGWRSKYQSAAGSRSAGITGPNQLWELDCSPADILLADGKRYTLIGCVDVGTRRARLQVAESSNSLAVCALLRRSLLDFGITNAVKVDNGKEYNNYLVTTALLDLGIHIDWCTPFTPEEKPHIERFFHTFQRSLTTAPGFIGHSVADRKAIESRRSFAERMSRKSAAVASRKAIANGCRNGEKPAMELHYTPEKFQDYCDTWCADMYGEKEHSVLGMSPNEAAARDEGAVRRITDERALDLLLLPVAGQDGVRQVGKQGIRVDKGKYNAPELGGLDGQEVQVRRDVRNRGYIYVFDLDGIFLCRAEDPSLTGMSERDLALARRRFQKAVVGEKVKEGKKIVAAVKPQEYREMIIAEEAEQAAENRAEREQRLGTERSVAYTTPALTQAGFAARAGEAPGSALTDQERETLTAKAREMLAEKPVWKIPVSDVARVAECNRLIAAEILGEDAPFAALNWMRAYRNSPTFKAFEEVRLAGEQAKAESGK